MKKFIYIFITSLAMVATLGTSVSAINDDAREDKFREKRSPASQTTTYSDSEEPKRVTSGKLDATKLRVCESKQARIRQLIEDTKYLGQGQLNLFDNIHNKIMRFAEDNKITVDQARLENLDEVKASAQEAVRVTNQSAINFDCNDQNPKDIANQFRITVQAQIQELKTYRTAIKELASSIKLSAINKNEE